MQEFLAAPRTDALLVARPPSRDHVVPGRRCGCATAACDGDGALTITVNGRATVLDCSQSAATGPINVSAAIATDAPSGVELAVRPSAGHPRYIAKAVSVSPEQAMAPAS